MVCVRRVIKSEGVIYAFLCDSQVLDVQPIAAHLEVFEFPLARRNSYCGVGASQVYHCVFKGVCRNQLECQQWQQEQEEEFVEAQLNAFLSERITNPGLGFDVEICMPEEVCALEHYPENASGDIFAAERIISTSLAQQDVNPKKVKIFLWRKK